MHHCRTFCTWAKIGARARALTRQIFRSRSQVLLIDLRTHTRAHLMNRLFLPAASFQVQVNFYISIIARQWTFFLAANRQQISPHDLCSCANKKKHKHTHTHTQTQNDAIRSPLVYQSRKVIRLSLCMRERENLFQTLRLISKCQKMCARARWRANVSAIYFLAR